MPDVFHNMSKRVVAAMTVGVVLPASTVITLAATGSFNNSAVVASSAVPTSSYVTSDTSNYASSAVVSSDVASSSAVSSSKGSDNVANDIDAIQKATDDGLDKINSAASKAIDDINSAKSASSITSSSKPKVISTFGIPAPDNEYVEYDGVTDTEQYNAAIKAYNDYAASVGAKQDAGEVETGRSEAIRAWGKAHGWKTCK